MSGALIICPCGQVLHNNLDTMDHRLKGHFKFITEFDRLTAIEENSALKSKLEKAREIAVNYTGHRGYCPRLFKRDDVICDCGLDEALAEIGE